MNSLADVYPSVARYWHPHKNLLPVEKCAPQSNRKVWWLCSQGHEWEAYVSNTVRSSAACPVCLNRKVLVGFNDIFTSNPELRSEWCSDKNQGIDPSNLTRGSKTKAWWQCKYGHQWQSRVSDRSIGLHGCPVCAGKIVEPGFNDLKSLHPHIAAYWHPVKNESDADSVTPYSNREVWWQCPQRHEWTARVYNIVRSKSVCPFCSNSKVLSGFNDLVTLYPAIAAQWHPTKNGNKMPSAVSPGSKTKTWWQCEQGHEWEASVVNRTRKGTSCPWCSGRIATPGINDLLYMHPHLAREWHPTLNTENTPSGISPSANRKAWWICSNNPEHVWETWVYVRSRGSGCPQCSLVSSQAQLEINEFLVSCGLKTAMNMRGMLSAKNQELDIYLPDHKFAIEYNGVYWHSEAAGKGKYYHKDKMQAARDAGITLFQVWEDDWRDRKEIILRGLAHRLGFTRQLQTVLPDLPKYYTQTIGARQTKIITLDYNQSAEFLTEHHIQGGATGTHYLGLMDSKERLRAVLVLKRTGKTGELSIERYATAGTVSGGFTKLLKYAEKAYQPKRWVTFADLSISDGGLYEKTGFVVDKVLSPDYSYLVNGKRVHKFNYRLKRFREDPKLQYQEGLSERELAALNKIPRIWDSGKIRYVKDLNASGTPSGAFRRTG